MRVLLVTAHFRPHVGGIERFVETLAEGLVERGHSVSVLCCRTRAGSALEEDGPYRVVRVPSTTLLQRTLGIPYPIPDPRALRRALRKELASADVVHVQDALYLTSVAALRAARRAGIPSLLTQHVGFVPQAGWALDAVQRVALATLGRAARLATRVVALNGEVARFAERTRNVGPVDVLPVGVREHAADRAEERARFGFAVDRFVALFVGRDVPKKGLDAFLGAADPAFDLVAVTDRSGPAPAGVTLLPFMEHARLTGLYAAADAFVLPSVGEGMPVALQEAAAAGLPLVVTWDAGYAGVLDRPDVRTVERTSSSVRDALLELAADPALRASLGGRARAVADRSFSVSAFVNAYVTAYNNLTLD